jgi:hypothetical protein
VPDGTLTLHQRLVVHTSDGAEHEVPFWVDGDTVHASDPVRALLWAATPISVQDPSGNEKELRRTLPS